MAVPSFLASEYGHTQIDSTVDVQDIIDELVTALTGLTTPWTHSTGLFTSPVDAGGHQVAFQLTRISATVLDIDPVDVTGTEMFGVAITRRMHIVAAGDRVQLFYGPQYVTVETRNPGLASAEGEHFCVGILNLAPESQDSYTYPYYAGARRTSADALDSLGDTWSDYYTRNASTGVYTSNRYSMRPTSHVGTVISLRRMSGTLIHLPVDVAGLNNQALSRVIGRQYQVFMVNGSLEPLSDIQIPIDDDPLTLGTFRVSNRREGATTEFTRIAYRIA